MPTQEKIMVYVCDNCPCLRVCSDDIRCGLNFEMNYLSDGTNYSKTCLLKNIDAGVSSFLVEKKRNYHREIH